MYKENQKIVTFENDSIICNAETVARRKDCWRYYFNCSVCKNQSIADDENTLYSCNNFSEVLDTTGENIYCENYLLDEEYARLHGKK